MCLFLPRGSALQAPLAGHGLCPWKGGTGLGDGQRLDSLELPLQMSSGEKHFRGSAVLHSGSSADEVRPRFTSLSCLLFTVRTFGKAGLTAASTADLSEGPAWGLSPAAA